MNTAHPHDFGRPDTEPLHWSEMAQPPGGEPVGLLEIAERLGVEAQTARNWRTRGVLPAPSWTVSGAPAWPWAEIRRWAVQTGRLREDQQ